jgi:hypothetical protein
MNVKKKLCILLIMLFSGSLQSQILNAYAKVSAITSGSQLTVTNVNQASHTFTVGGKVIVMQMQDDVIGANTADVSTFGNLSGISSAGLYEIGIIASRSPATGTPTLITLTSPLANTYHMGANSSLQVVTYRNMGSNYTTSADITGLAWDGNVGGIIAFEVTNTLTLNHSINADVIGFRKGLINSNAVAGSCLPTLYRTSSNSEAFKGEGIYKSTDVNYTNARGKIINGGGGGNEHNGGGGGGGNYSAGGDGGFGYSCGTGSASGGIGGISLSPYIASNRIFMGGGGGGGQQNNTVGLDGGPGGGIILVKATTIVTNTICGSAIKITANGGSTASCGNDGAGGGGAAGTIVLQVSNYSVSAACPMAINANGGNGGNVSDGVEHGGGGGGGQGAVIFSISQPTINVSTITANGVGGKNNSGGNSYAGNGGGANNSGILTMGGPLPIEFLQFSGEAEFSKVNLYWATPSERNMTYYIVERSHDGVTFSVLGKQSAKGKSGTTISYELRDEDPLKGIYYYRLKQVDEKGIYSYSNSISILFESELDFVLFPNPTGTGHSVYLSIDKLNSATVELTIFDLTGKLILTQHLLPEKGKPIELTDIKLPKGIYTIRLFTENNSRFKKLVID